jgi:hypothetical protein
LSFLLGDGCDDVKISESFFSNLKNVGHRGHRDHRDLQSQEKMQTPGMSEDFGQAFLVLRIPFATL